jgi:hypothetical protein
MSWPIAGGSCLVQWKYDDFLLDAKGQFLLDANGNKQTTPHGYIREFDQHTDTIKSQLQQMYANGQRQLSLAVAYFEGGDTFALDCTGGLLTARDKANLQGLLHLALSIGFMGFQIEMIPEWTASYADWDDPAVMGQGNTRPWQPLEYDTILRFTFAVSDAVDEALGPIQHYINLLGECANKETGRRLWMDWCAMKGGAANALGFAMIANDPATIDLIPSFYANGIYPSVFLVDFWGDNATWPNFVASMRAKGYTQGFIVQESLCDQPALTGPDLFWQYVWPNGVNTPRFMTQDRLTVNQKFPS